jgi:Na+/H+ antiporter NhaB
MLSHGAVRAHPLDREGGAHRAGESQHRLVIESLWSQLTSECQRCRHPPRLNHSLVIVLQGVASLMLILGLAFHVTEVGFVGLAIGGCH